jgi:hypothetical protein
MRYITKQQHAFTCGPVAIVNVLRSFGVKASYMDIVNECGGLKHFKKRGTTINKFIKVMAKHNIKCYPIHATRKRMLQFASAPNSATCLVYVWLLPKHNKGKRLRGGPHVVMINKNGKALNVNKQSAVNGQRWRDTRKAWNFPPITIVCVPKAGGAR